jgi:hypothetical protein
MGKKRTYLPVVKEPVPEFTPVPRKYRYDGWTPERQKAFIAALAETGCVDRAARLVNIARTNCYELRRAPGAEEFRRAWDAALDFGLKRLKDIAFERAIEGYLVPVFVAGKLMGFRRKHNDALLMFCLRHYGEDAGGKRVTVNYFSTRASAGAVLRDGASTGSGPPQDERIASGAAAQASATTVRTVITGPGANDNGADRLDAAAAVLEGFEGVRLDVEAEAAIRTALEACAARARDAQAAVEQGGEEGIAAALDLPDSDFVRTGPMDFHGELVPAMPYEEVVPFIEGESSWRLAGAEMPPEWAEVARKLEAANDAAPDAAPPVEGPRPRAGHRP